MARLLRLLSPPQRLPLRRQAATPPRRHCQLPARRRKMMRAALEWIGAMRISLTSRARRRMLRTRLFRRQPPSPPPRQSPSLRQAARQSLVTPLRKQGRRRRRPQHQSHQSLLPHQPRLLLPTPRPLPRPMDQLAAAASTWSPPQCCPNPWPRLGKRRRRLPRRLQCPMPLRPRGGLHRPAHPAHPVRRLCLALLGQSRLRLPRQHQPLRHPPRPHLPTFRLHSAPPPPPQATA